MVTTPELPLPNQEEIFSKLDKIQIALSACDLLRTYQLSATPPLSFLVNIPKRERNLPEERRYIVSLMKGHASLLLPHDFLRASRSTEMTRSPPNQSKESPSLAEALIVQMCLCLSISRGENSIEEEEEEANLSLEQYFDLIIQLVSDLLELESGILQMKSSPITEHEEEEEGGGLTLWIGAIVLHAILELCPQSVVSCLVERLLYSSSVLSSEKKEVK